MAGIGKDIIRQWGKDIGGRRWTYDDMNKDLDLSPTVYATRRALVKQMIDSGEVIRVGGRVGVFRFTNNSVPILEWETADITATIPLRWPFKLEEYTTLYPKNICVLAGAPNAGKTAFLLNVIYLNMDEFDIDYYTSEMGPEEMKLRLSKFEGGAWKFRAYERSTNFAEVINPNRISIIDYLEITTDFFLVAQELMAIFDKLEKGIAIIALQKKRDVGSMKYDLGRGAEFSLEKPRLYLSMDNGRLKIVKAKNWAQQGVNPNNMEWTFGLVDGAKFVNPQRSELL